MGPRQRGVDAGDASEVNKMVKVKILKEDEESIKVLLTDTDRAFVNAIRRTLMSDTPKTVSYTHLTLPTIYSV